MSEQPTNPCLACYQQAVMAVETAQSDNPFAEEAEYECLKEAGVGRCEALSQYFQALAAIEIP